MKKSFKKKVSVTDDMKADLKRRTEETVSDGEGFGGGKTSVLDVTASKRPVKWYKVKSGKENKNHLNIIPYIIRSDWYEKMKNHSNRPTGVKVGKLDYKLEIPFHRLPTGQMILCLNFAFGKSCAICEEVKNMQGHGEKESKWKPLQAKWKCYYNVIDVDNPDKGIQIFDSSFYLFEKYLKAEAQSGRDGVIPFCSLDEGMVVVARGKLKSIGEGKKQNEFVECDDIEFDEREEQYDSNILSKVYPLDKMLIVPTPEQVSEDFFGYEEGEEMGKKKSKKKHEEEEEVKPKKKVRRK